LNKNKFIDIASHSHYNISIALSINGIYYIWGKCGGELIEEPKETKLESFDDIFNQYFGITYNPKERFIDFEIKLIKNKNYLKKYFEIEKIGEGFYGEVFKARTENKYSKQTPIRSSENCAVKKLKFTKYEFSNLCNELENFVLIEDLFHDSVVTFDEIWLEDQQINTNDDEKY
jgi:hypothetical protein